MEITFTVTCPPEEHEDLIPFTNALQRDMFLFELFHNFSKPFRDRENLDIEEIMDVIFELKEQYGVI